MDRTLLDLLRSGKDPTRGWLSTLAQGIASFSDRTFNTFVDLPATQIHDAARALGQKVNRLCPPPPDAEETDRLRRMLDDEALALDDEVISGLMRCSLAQARTGVVGPDMQVEQEAIKDLAAIDFGLQLYEVQVRDAQRALSAWQHTAQTRVASAIFAELMDPKVPEADKSGLLIDAAEIIVEEERRVGEVLDLREKQATEASSLKEAAEITARKATLLQTMRALRAGEMPPKAQLRELARFYEESGGVALFSQQDPQDDAGRRTVTR